MRFYCTWNKICVRTTITLVIGCPLMISTKNNSSPSEICTLLGQICSKSCTRTLGFPFLAFSLDQIQPQNGQRTHLQTFLSFILTGKYRDTHALAPRFTLCFPSCSRLLKAAWGSLLQSSLLFSRPNRIESYLLYSEIPLLGACFVFMNSMMLS